MTETIVALIPHLFEDETLIRQIMRGGEPWFVLVDICRALGIKNPSKAVLPLDEDEKGLTISATNGGPQTHIVVSESGLYTIMVRSHAAMQPGTTAHRFRRWMTGDLLPQIRKTGRYDPQAKQAAHHPDDLSIMEKDKLVNTMCRVAGPRAGYRLWQALGLMDITLPPPDQHEFTFDATPVIADEETVH